jgi:hypothetical protein
MNGSEPADDLSPRRLVYDFFNHEASRTHDRTDWFLIFHAILLEAYFGSKPPFSIPVVGSVGVIMAFLWLMTGIRQRWLMMQLGTILADGQVMGQRFSSTYEAIFAGRRAGLARDIGSARPVAVFCVVTPALFVLAWTVLIALGSAELQSALITLGVDTAFCALSVVVAGRLGPGPRIPESVVALVAEAVRDGSARADGRGEGSR